MLLFPSYLMDELDYLFACGSFGDLTVCVVFGLSRWCRNAGGV